ncbi:SIR2 family protein [Kribbella sp. CA-245084]|uniref:SIR2 family protein n=1 Tax=Kribbella sp. CA-245084 TaxID=3239940 RepID=UPI003D8DF4A3
MPGVPAWQVTPHGRRSLSEVATAAETDSQAARLVLLVGAGVDQSLNHRPGWTDLLGDVAKAGDVHVNRTELNEVSNQWPMESAEALRITLGPTGYTDGIRKAVPFIPGDTAAATPLAKAITRLVSGGVSLIVSLNYTDDLIDVLRANLPSEFGVRVIERTELSAWPLGQLFQPPKNQVNVLRLHGAIPFDGVVGEPVVLSRSTYDAALSADSPYRAILSRLFEDYVVLSVGVSWNDVALRDAAATVRRKLPIARPMHYATLQQVGTTRDWWEQRALTASYGVRPLYYKEHEEVAQILDSIADMAAGLRTPAADSPLEEIASWLDDVGDYESRQQSSWFAQGDTPNWQAMVDAIRRACDGDSMDPGVWLACARIESHLRHFLWFWLPISDRSATRKTLWTGIARSWASLGLGAQSELWNSDQLQAALSWRSQSPASTSRALLQFAIGAHEVMGRGPQAPVVEEWRNRLSVLAHTGGSSITAKRSGLARQVWTDPASPRLLAEVQNAYWEGIEAKVALDLVEMRIKDEAGARTAVDHGRSPTMRDWPDSLRADLFGQCDHVRELARVVGSTRREVGAIVLASFFIPADQAEGYLIAAYRRMTEMSAGRPEPTATWAVIIGLIAAYSDQASGVEDARLVPVLCEWLQDKCGRIPLDEPIADAVEQVYAVFWKRFHPRAAELAVGVAKSLLATAG